MLGETIKICMISPDFIPVWSGIGSYTVTLLEQISEDVEIHLITLKRELPTSRFSNQSASHDAFQSLSEKVHIYNVSSARDTFAYHLKFQLACLKNLPNICKHEKIDIIHTNFPLMSDIFVKLLRQIKIPTISTVQSTIDGQHKGVSESNMSVSSLEVSDLANLLLYYPLKVCEMLYVRKIPHFIAISESIKREIIHYLNINKDRFHIIYHGVDTRRFSSREKQIPSLELEKNRPVVLFTGRFVATKGIDVLARAVPKVLKRFPNVLFLFVGGGNSMPYMHLLRKKGVAKRNFSFEGYVDFFEMPSLYASTSIYVAPTIYEPLGIRVLEAMSCEKPVIASRVGGIPEIIESGKDGLLIAPRDVDGLANSLIRLLEDESFAKSIGKRGRQKVLEKFSAEEMAQRTVSLYKQILTGSHMN